MEKKHSKQGFFGKLFAKDTEEIKILKAIKKKVRKIKTVEDLDAIEEELIAIGVLDKEELEKRKKSKKKRKSQKEVFEERIRCNLEIINRTILVGKQFKEEKTQVKDEEKVHDRDERSRQSGKAPKERDEKIR